MNLKDKINTLDEYDLKAILERLLSSDKNLSAKIESVINDYMKDDELDVNEIAEDVKATLESIDIDEFFGSSGSSRHGYVDPNEESWEMFEAELQDDIKQMKTYFALALYNEWKLYCMGILLGLYKYEKESNEDFKDWVADAPGHFFQDILKGWIKECPNTEMLKEMDSFIKENCPGFSTN